MSYQIQYPISNPLEKKYILKKRISKRLVIAVVSVVLLSISVYLAGHQQVIEYIVPGDNAVTVSAFVDMQSNLKNGMSIKNALTIFCKAILESANIK